jgi:cytochrome c556
MKMTLERIASIGAVVALGLAAAGCSGGGEAVDDSPEGEAYMYRDAVMHAIAHKMGSLGGMARGEITVDEDQFVKDATDLGVLAGMATEGFMPQGTPAGSRAMPEIWENWDDFQQKAQAFEDAAQSLSDAAESGGFMAAQGLVQPVAQTCGGCHRTYRAPEE